MSHDEPDSQLSVTGSHALGAEISDYYMYCSTHVNVSTFKLLKQYICTKFGKLNAEALYAFIIIRSFTVYSKLDVLVCTLVQFYNYKYQGWK